MRAAVYIWADGKSTGRGAIKTRCGPGVGSGRQSGLRKTVDDPLDILLSFERQPAEMLAERVFRIDLHEFAPDASGLVDLAEMAKGGRKRGAGKIRSGHEADAFPEMSCRCFVLAGQQVCRAQEVEVLLTLSRVQTHGPFDHWNCFQRLSREAANGANNVVSHSVIRVQRQRDLGLGHCPIEVSFV